MAGQQLYAAPSVLLCLPVVRSNQVLPSVAAVALPEDEDQEEQEDSAAERASWTRERSIAEALVGKVIQQWQGPISTLSRAGKAFEGLEALLGGAQGGGFDLGVSDVFLIQCIGQCTRCTVTVLGVCLVMQSIHFALVYCHNNQVVC